MATCRHIVNSALRKIGRLGAGREPRVADQTDTLAALEGLYGSWVSSGAFGRLQDVVPTGTTYTARGGERILRQDTLDVVLPELVSDASYNDYGRHRDGYYGTVVSISTVGNQTIIDVKPGQPIGYALPPRDASAVIITDTQGGNTASWLYDGHIKRWERLETLQLDDEAPRSKSDPEGLSAALAMEVADQFGAEIGPTTLRQGNRYLAALTQRFGMRSEPAAGVYC